VKSALCVVSVQVVRWCKGGTVKGGDFLVGFTLGVVRVQVVRWCKGGTVKGWDFIA